MKGEDVTSEVVLVLVVFMKNSEKLQKEDGFPITSESFLFFTVGSGHEDAVTRHCETKASFSHFTLYLDIHKSEFLERQL